MNSTMILMLLAGINLGALTAIFISFKEIAKKIRDHKKRVISLGQCGDREIAKLRALSDLCLHLIPLKIEFDVKGVNAKGRHVVLDPKVWPKQFGLGVKRACGFDIDWNVNGVKNAEPDA